MMPRQAVFALSLLVSLFIYAALYVFAPQIFLFRADASGIPRDIPKPLKVMLYNGPMPESPPAERPTTTALASRPGSVRDLILEQTKELPLVEPTPAEQSPT